MLLNDEQLVPVSEAIQRLPFRRGGRPVGRVTAWRWVTDGATARDGQRVRLEAVKLGRSFFTSVEALERFVARLSAEPAPPPPALCEA